MTDLKVVPEAVRIPDEKINRLADIINALIEYQDVLEEALAYADNSHCFDDVCERVINGELDMYVLENSIMLCEILEHPNFRQYHVYLGGGDLEEIIAYTDQMVKEGQMRGCKYLSMTGRLGWGKALKPTGWTHKLSIYKKEI